MYLLKLLRPYLLMMIAIDLTLIKQIILSNIPILQNFLNSFFTYILFSLYKTKVDSSCYLPLVIWDTTPVPLSHTVPLSHYIFSNLIPVICPFKSCCSSPSSVTLSMDLARVSDFINSSNSSIAALISSLPL